MADFKEITCEDMRDNVFKLIGTDWMLLTAGDKGHFNTMTANWGGMGVLWNRPVAFIFVRKTRYTFEFLERQNPFTLSFFSHEYHGALNLCGSKSGRDIDKVKESGLSPVFSDNGSVYFGQARMVLLCSQLYMQDLNPVNFLDVKILQSFYPDADYHRLYVGEIKQCLLKE